MVIMASQKAGLFGFSSDDIVMGCVCVWGGSTLEPGAYTLFLFPLFTLEDMGGLWLLFFPLIMEHCLAVAPARAESCPASPKGCLLVFLVET